MSNLIPEKRLDKTGKLVTRHVKSETSAASLRVIPAPPAPSSMTPAVAAQQPLSPTEYDESVVTVMSKISRFTKNMQDNLARMSKMTPDTFREVVQEFANGDEYHGELCALILDFPPQNTAKFNRALLIELAAMDVIAELRPDSKTRSSPVPRITRGEEIWRASRKAVYSLPERATFPIYRATIFAVWAITDFEFQPFDAAAEIENIKYIADNFDAVLEYRRLIHKRQSIDQGFIESVIGAAPAISEGILWATI